MKKFTDKPVAKKIDNSVGNDIKSLIEESLTISVNGELDKFISESISIDGSEALVTKLTDYVNDLVARESFMLLERVKYVPFKLLESEYAVYEHQTPSELKKHRYRIENLLEKGDIETLAKRQADKIRNGDKAYYRALAAQHMMAEDAWKSRKKDLKKIYDIFFFRAKALGYRV